MKCHPLRWIWGLIPLALFSWVAALTIKEPVERDLSARVTQALANANLGWAKVNFDGRDGTLSGQADDESEPSKAIVLSNDVYGVRILDGQADLLRKVEPYTFEATRSETKVRLSGFVPNEKSYKAVLAAAKAQFPNLEIEPKLEFARGNPPVADWLDGVKFDLKQLGHLKSGKAELSGLDVSVSGEALTSGDYSSVKTALWSNMPKALKLGSEKVTAPHVHPYLWAAKLAGNQVTLTGYVPNDKVRERLLAHANKVFGKTSVVDKMEFAEGAPEHWEKATRVSLDQLATLQEGMAELRGKDASLQGNAADEGTADATKKAFKSDIPEGFKREDVIRVPAAEAEKAKREAAKREAEMAAAKREAEQADAAKRDAEAKVAARRDVARTAERDAEEAKRQAALAADQQSKQKAASVCEGDLRNIANAGTVQFERASDVLLRASRPTLKLLAEVATKCENVLIEIAGHTDSEGIPERNQPLSERRAQSVVEYLVDAGVNAERIKSVGYGDTRPIAPNDTAENRAKNRRIEFSVTSK